MVADLKNKTVIITAGPTWVKIDSVRVISNTATGLTGILLAKKLSRIGAKVTLLLGPVCHSSLENRARLIRFKFFDELKNILKKELSSRRYDLAIHSAAVADYKPVASYKGKISSGLTDLKINFKATDKLIDIFKRIQPDITLIAFKFEPASGKKKLISKARKLIQATGSRFIVANTLKGDRYTAYLVSADKCRGPFHNKVLMVNKLTAAIKESYA